MADNLPTVQIPAFSYDVKPMDIGSGYAAGITEAGKGIAAGLHDVLDVATRNQNASDLLQVMNQNKILSDEAYKSIAGKSLGAKESMLGLYAGEWIKQQAQERELQKIGYTGAVQQQVEHGKLLDAYGLNLNLLRGGITPPGYDPKKWIVNPQTGQPQPAPQQTTTPQTPAPRAVPVNAAPPVKRGTLVQATPQNVTGTPTPSFAQLGPSPNVAMKSVGPPLPLSDPIPPGSQRKQIKLPDGTLVDGVLTAQGIFHPRPAGQ
jgi:hypothetical protein